MLLVLSGPDLARLLSAISTLLSPSEHGSLEEWARAVLSATRPTVRADRAEIYLPEWVMGRAILRAWRQGPDGEETVPIEPPPIRRAATSRRPASARHALGNRLTLHERHDAGRTEVAVRVAGEAGIDPTLSFRGPAGTPWPLERDLMVLHLLGPAFQAGVSASLESSLRRAALPRMLDDLGMALALFDSAGRVLHRTATLERLLESGEAPSRLRSLVMDLGGLAARRQTRFPPHGDFAPDPLTRQVGTDRERYAARAFSIADAFASNAASVVVSLEQLHAGPFTDEALRDRYRLTPREIEVARLLYRGVRNEGIADALRISARTAEHHTQRVLKKLQAHSRAQVAARLRGE